MQGHIAQLAAFAMYPQMLDAAQLTNVFDIQLRHFLTPQSME